MRRLRPAGPPPTQTTSYISSFVVEYERRHWLREGREQLLQTKFEIVIRPRAPAIVACGIVACSKSPHNINWWLKVDEARALEVGRCYALQCQFHPNSVRTMYGGTMTGLRVAFAPHVARPRQPLALDWAGRGCAACMYHSCYRQREPWLRQWS